MEVVIPTKLNENRASGFGDMAILSQFWSVIGKMKKIDILTSRLNNFCLGQSYDLRFRNMIKYIIKYHNRWLNFHSLLTGSRDVTIRDMSIFSASIHQKTMKLKIYNTCISKNMHTKFGGDRNNIFYERMYLNYMQKQYSSIL